MPSCCRCNGNGRCRNCRCVRSGSACFNCLPFRRGHCENCEEAGEDLSPRPAVSSIQLDIDALSFSEEASELSSSSDESAAVDSPVSESESTLPSFVRIADNLNFVWGDVDGATFSSLLDQVYNEIVHWRRNIFPLPTGGGGKMFVCELSRLFNAYYPGSSLEGIALKAAMSLPILILQKPFSKSKASDHIQCIQRRLKLWLSGDLTALLEEGRSIQRGLTCRRVSNESRYATGSTFVTMVTEARDIKV